ncbi:MAG: hypothetical protein WKG00_12125 [Polyangiaceae bacterium]
MILHQSRHFVVSRDGPSLLVVMRTSERFDSIEEMKKAFGEVHRALDAAGRASNTLLVDTRSAPSRNDPEFEATFEPLRVRLLGGFRRVAVLARTLFGRLQVERHAREDSLGVRVFNDEAEARAYCDEPTSVRRSRPAR